MRIPGFICALVLLQLVFSSCNRGNSYSEIVNRELQSGKRVNDIFFDIKFGMASKDFYMYCWNMNKKGMFRDGLNNQYVLYKPKQDDFKHPVSMNFYPDFLNGKIARMRVLYQYDEWAPWNKGQYADSLINDVLNYYKRAYPGGNPFLTIHNKQKGDIYVKVDGNRRITVGKLNDLYVKVDFTDLLTEKELTN